MNSYIYSAAQIKGASPKHPHTKQEAGSLIRRAWECFEKITKGEPSNPDMAYFCTLYNFVEQAIDSGLMSDEDGAIGDAFASLSKAVVRAVEGKSFRLDGQGIVHAEIILDAYGAMAMHLPRRDWMKNINRTQSTSYKARKECKDG